MPGAVADTTKKAADTVVDAVTPDTDAHKVDVKLVDHRIEMPKQIEFRSSLPKTAVGKISKKDLLAEGTLA